MKIKAIKRDAKVSVRVLAKKDLFRLKGFNEVFSTFEHNGMGDIKAINLETMTISSFCAAEEVERVYGYFQETEVDYGSRTEPKETDDGRSYLGPAGDGAQMFPQRT